MRARSSAWHFWLWGGVALAWCDRCCPTCASSSACPEDRDSGVLREQGVCWCLRGGGGGWGGGLGVWTVYEMACFLTLLPSLRCRPSCNRAATSSCCFAVLHGGSSDSVLRRLSVPVPAQGWLMVQTVPKTVWRFVVAQKTIKISHLQFIDKVLPYVVAQRQIPMVLRQCRKLRGFRSCKTTWVRGSSWTRLSSCPLRADSAGVQTCSKLWCSAVAVLGQSGHARCCDDRCMGVQFLNKRWYSPLLRRQVRWVPQVQFRRLWTSL